MTGDALAVPYTLVVVSAARPALLARTLASVFWRVDQLPVRAVVHDDAVFPGRERDVRAALALTVPLGVPVDYRHDDPPVRHGYALRWALTRVETEYVLYTQDDFEVLRPLPVARALAVMDAHGLHQVRFNKRATMGHKETWQGPWRKEERRFWMLSGTREHGDACDFYSQFNPLCVWDAEVTLTVSDHWYFQTGLWRVQPIRDAVEALARGAPSRLAGDVEGGVNALLDGHGPWAVAPNVPAAVRAERQRTYIWGPIGEDRFVQHLGAEQPARPRHPWEARAAGEEVNPRGEEEGEAEEEVREGVAAGPVGGGAAYPGGPPAGPSGSGSDDAGEEAGP